MDSGYLLCECVLWNSCEGVKLRTDIQSYIITKVINLYTTLKLICSGFRYNLTYEIGSLVIYIVLHG